MSLKASIAILILIISAFSSAGQEMLPRRAYWGADYKSTTEGVQLTSVSENYAFGLAGLKAGDIIINIDGYPTKERADIAGALKGKKEGDKFTVAYKRNGKEKKANITSTPFPFEQADGLTFEYGSFRTSSGDHLRTIVSKPENVNGKLPAILFIQWLSCDAIDEHPVYKDGNIQLIHDLSKAGYLVMRTEKPGVGDSQGRDCGSYGFNDEVQVHKEALEVLKKRGDVDLENIILFGSSIGGSMAPIIAQGQTLKGIMVTGCYYKTWYEHMLEIERRISFLSGDSPDITNKKMKLWSEFYSYYLNDKRTPGDILKQHPKFREVWGDDPPAHQYGRPVSFYMEANDHNIPNYWDQLEVPTLVIYGEYDYIMSRQDHQMIVDAMNRKKKGLGTYLEMPGADHGLTIYESQQAAFDSFSPKYNETLTQEVIKWLKKI